MSPNFSTHVGLYSGTLANCHAFVMEFKKPWPIFSVELLQIAPWQAPYAALFLGTQ